MSLTIGMTYDLRKDYLAMGLSEEEAAEFDSEETVASLENAIRALGYRTVRIGHARELSWRLVTGDRWDLVFNIAEGWSGRCREAQVPSLLELYGIGYTFSDPLVCAATLDKSVAKHLIASHGLPTPAFAVVREPGDAQRVSLEYPLFVKPLAEGTGKGISRLSRVESPRELAALCEELLKRFAQPVLVEEYLPGREFTVGILGNGAGARAIGVMEILSSDGSTVDAYSFDAKENWEVNIRYSTLRASSLRRRVEAVALGAYRALECRDAARVDIRLDPQGEPAFMEINPLPGLHPTHSDLPMLARREGMEYTELIGAIIAAALSRMGTPQCSRIIQVS